jgi:hypothetical protein
MATVRKELRLTSRPDQVWAALADFGAVHQRVAPGFVTECQLDGNARLVTFANGSKARELLVTSDAAARRLVYAIPPGDRIAHYSASVEVFPDGEGSRLVWTIDLLPDALAPYVDGQTDIAVRAMKPALER